MEVHVPRRLNYLPHVKKWAKSCNGAEGLKLALLHTINLFIEGNAKIEEVNKMVIQLQKTCTVVQVDDTAQKIEDELAAYLANELEN